MADEGYPISAVERWTGLGADTIRAWERRHGAIQPERSRGNVRRYGPAQVRRLLLLQEATRRGHAIGQVSGLSSDALRRLVREDHDALEILASWHDQRQSRALADAYLSSLSRLDGDESKRLLLLAKQLFEPLGSSFLGPLHAEMERRWPWDDVEGPAPFVRALFLQQLRGLLFEPALTSGACKVLVAAQPSRRTWGLLVALVLAQEGLETVLMEDVAAPSDLRWPVGLSGADRLVFVGEGAPPEAHRFDHDAAERELEGESNAGCSTSLAELEELARAWGLNASAAARR